MDYLIPARRPDIDLINKKKRIYNLKYFPVSADRVKMKESEKRKI